MLQLLKSLMNLLWLWLLLLGTSCIKAFKCCKLLEHRREEQVGVVIRSLTWVTRLS